MKPVRNLHSQWILVVHVGYGRQNLLRLPVGWRRSSEIGPSPISMLYDGFEFTPYGSFIIKTDTDGSNDDNDLVTL